MPEFTTAREIVIAAPPATIHAILNDFRQWSGWSPWEELDPQLQRTFSGPETGVGSHYAWVGNNKVGQGSMEITESTPERIAFDLEFLKPFKASNKGLLELRPEGDGTRVVWSMTGQRNVVLALLGKLFMDKVIGKDFEKASPGSRRSRRPDHRADGPAGLTPVQAGQPVHSTCPEVFR